MFSLELQSDEEGKELLIAELSAQGTLGITEIDDSDGRCRLRAFFDDEARIDFLLLLFAAHSPRVQDESTHDWIAESRANWEPLTVGERFYLVAEWRDDPAPPGRFRIAINPGLACGTGYHEATQLCLEALERYADASTMLLDVGCGAGILSIAASLLGVSKVTACDADPIAVEIAAAAFKRAGTRALLFTGSAPAVRSGSVNLILSNISAAACIELAPDCLRCLAPGGRCVLSGFEVDESTAVAGAVKRSGGTVEEEFAKNTWRALVITVSR